MAGIIAADRYLREVQFLPRCEGEFSIGIENDYRLKVPSGIGIEKRWFVMMEDTEYGGVVDGVTVDTADADITITGRTWHGILEYSPVLPDDGADYLTVSGDCNAVMAQLVDRWGLGDVFAVPAEASGFSVAGYRFSRLSNEMGGYTALRKMLRSVGAKLRISYDAAVRKAVLSAVPRGDYSEDGVDGDRVRLVISDFTPVNHLHCMGTGEGANRLRADLYADSKGRVSRTQTIFGIAHKCEVYDNPASDMESLIEDGTKRLQDYQAAMASCSMPEIYEEYDIDDIVGGSDIENGLEVVTSVAQKIATVDSFGVSNVDIKTELEV